MAAPRNPREASSRPQARSGTGRARRTIGEHAKVAVVSQQRLVRDAIRVALLSRGFTAVAFSTPANPGNPAELWELSRQLRKFGGLAGLLVCDLDDPSQLRDATAVIADVPVRWLVLTGTPSGPGWGAMVEAGAAGVVSMSTGLDQLAHAVKAVVAGRPAMSASARLRVLRQWQAQGAELGVLAERMATLTPREMAILDHLREGEPVKAIAEAAGVSEGTVRSQVKSILRKLGVSSQLGAVAVYRRVSAASEGGRPADS